MKYPRIIAEAGSCHGGDLGRAIKMIKTAAECGAWAIKFQLFPDAPEYTGLGNIYLPREWLPALWEVSKKHLIEIFASVFDAQGIKDLLSIPVRYMKIPYGKQKENLRHAGIKRIVSHDFMDFCFQEDINLWCIPLYPVPYVVNFKKVFDRFDGFSDHTLGMEQSHIALQEGCDYLEKHFKLEDSPECPDSLFAITPRELDKLVNLSKVDSVIRQIQESKKEHK